MPWRRLAPGHPRGSLRGEPLTLRLEDIDASLTGPADTDSEAESEVDSDADSDAGHGASPRARRAAPAVLGPEVTPASQIVGPRFMKHAQSRADVLTYLAERGPEANAPVNRREQTLLDLHEAHRVLRRPTNPDPHVRSSAPPQIYSTSIELKRIGLLDKAIRHAAVCSGPEALALSAAMSAVDQRWRDRYLSPQHGPSLP